MKGKGEVLRGSHQRGEAGRGGGPRWDETMPPARGARAGASAHRRRGADGSEEKAGGDEGCRAAAAAAAGDEGAAEAAT